MVVELSSLHTEQLPYLVFVLPVPVVRRPAFCMSTTQVLYSILEYALCFNTE